MRKNPDIWMKWNGAHALNLHCIQYRISRRGAEMLAVGGRMVYSTCSINPVENEAVISRLLRESEGSLELVDASSLVKGLVFNPGMTTWEIASKDMNFYSKHEDVPVEYHTFIHKEMFPPSAEEAEKLNLKKCMRVLPHHQNTGAFFIAVIEKRKQLPWEKKVDDTAVETKARIANEVVAVVVEGEESKQVVENPRKKRKINYGFREDPFVFFSPDEEVFKMIKSFYQLRDEFDPTCLLTRCLTGKKKNIYLCSKEVRSVLRNNENIIKLINSGVKTFSRCDNRNMECSFRLAHEGLHNVDQYIGNNRRLHVVREDLIKMLNNLNPLEPPQIVNLSEQVQAQHAAIGSGSCIVHYKDDNMELHLVGWRGNKTLRAYIDVNDSIHMIRLLGGDLSKYELNKFEEKAKRGQLNENEEEEIAEDMTEDNENVLTIDEN